MTTKKDDDDKNNPSFPTLEEIAKIKVGEGVWDFKDFYQRPSDPKPEEKRAHELNSLAIIFQGPRKIENTPRLSNNLQDSLSSSERVGRFIIKGMEINLKTDRLDVNGKLTHDVKEIGRMRYYADKLEEKVTRRVCGLNPSKSFYSPSNLISDNKTKLALPIASFLSISMVHPLKPYLGVILPLIDRNYVIYQVQNNESIKGFGILYFEKDCGIRMYELEMF